MVIVEHDFVVWDRSAVIDERERDPGWVLLIVGLLREVDGHGTICCLVITIKFDFISVEIVRCTFLIVYRCCCIHIEGLGSTGGMTVHIRFS